MRKILILFIFFGVISSCTKEEDFRKKLENGSWELISQERNGVNIYTGTSYIETHFYNFTELNKGNVKIEREDLYSNSTKRYYEQFEIVDEGKKIIKRQGSILIRQKIVYHTEDELILNFVLLDGEYVEYYARR